VQISIPWHGQNVCSICINPKSFVWNYKSEVLCLKPKNKDKGNNSKRIGKSVLPIYTATTKAIINRKFAIINAKYNEISQINKTQVRVAYVMMGAFHAPRRWWGPCAAQFCAATDTLCVVVVSRECRGAKIDYFPSSLILTNPGRNYCIT
jgi:hypothetical protein